MKIKSFFNRILLFILIIFAGFVFWLGWEQLQLTENTYGVIFTKTSGWKENIIDTEGFNWSFEKVIPRNYTIHKFIINEKEFSYKVNNILPSAKLYADFNGILSNNFEYSYNLNGSFKFNKTYLLTMIKAGNFNQETFPNWEENKIDEIQNSLKTFIEDKIISNEIITINGASRSYISDLYPHLLIGDIFININKPDMVLYNLSRNRYIKNMEAQAKADEKYLVKALEQKNKESLRLELLRKYGEVFTKYPIMIEYLKVDKNMVLDRAKMEDFISPLNQK